MRSNDSAAKAFSLLDSLPRSSGLAVYDFLSDFLSVFALAVVALALVSFLAGAVDFAFAAGAGFLTGVSFTGVGGPDLAGAGAAVGFFGSCASIHAVILSAS